MVPRSIDEEALMAIFADIENGKCTDAYALSRLLSLGMGAAEAYETIFISHGGSDLDDGSQPQSSSEIPH